MRNSSSISPRGISSCPPEPYCRRLTFGQEKRQHKHSRGGDDRGTHQGADKTSLGHMDDEDTEQETSYQGNFSPTCAHQPCSPPSERIVQPTAVPSPVAEVDSALTLLVGLVRLRRNLQSRLGESNDKLATFLAFSQKHRLWLAPLDLELNCHAFWVGRQDEEKKVNFFADKF